MREAASPTKKLEGDPDSLILVVDDEAYNCEVLRIMLETLKIPNLDKRLVTCMSGKEALQAVKEDLAAHSRCRYAAVLTDLSMPVMDGYQLVSQLKTLLRQEKQPVIAAITGHTEQEFVDKAFAVGVDFLYSKPISRDQHKDVLER